MTRYNRYGSLVKILRLARMLEGTTNSWSWQSLADELRVSRRTVRRYVEALQQSGARIRVTRGDDATRVGPLVWVERGRRAA